jgi:1-acyl-sn-glycerol-3-phosphate acyltransferase
MNRPTSEQMAPLLPVERFWFRVADVVLRYFRPVSIVWNRLFMVHFSWVLTGPRVRVWGLEHLKALGPTDCVIFASNHRSFFDFYIIGPILYTRTRLSKHILFPVRSTFFFDRWAGGLINGVMSGFFMFPPIMRGKEKRGFNAYALDRMVAELERPGQQLGIHPEGTRGKGDDPYTFLRPQPGVGTILSRSHHTVVVPVFVTGLTNSMGTELRRSWSKRRADHPVDVVFGPVMEFDDLRSKGDRLSVQMEMTHRVMDGIAQAAEHHRKDIAPKE